MYEPFAGDGGFGEPDVQLVVVMKVREVLAAVAKRREPVFPARPWTMLNVQFRQSSDQFCTQISHLPQPIVSPRLIYSASQSRHHSADNKTC